MSQDGLTYQKLSYIYLRWIILICLCNLKPVMKISFALVKKSIVGCNTYCI